MDAEKFLIEFQDYLAPKLDTYEQAIYLYIVRHSRLVGEQDVVIGFKSARKRIAFGTGKSQSVMSDNVCYKKLRSLQSKGFIEVISSERRGTRVAAKLPNEIDGLVAEMVVDNVVDLELEDFFSLPTQRERILEREQHRCFYCLCELNQDNYVIEHVASRPSGSSNYRNVAAACRRCNNRKGESSAKDYLRVLLREERLSDGEFEERLMMLDKLQKGDLKPM